MSSNVGTAPEPRPGAYHVAQRAAGAYPAWARQAPTGQRPSSSMSSPHPTPEPGSVVSSSQTTEPPRRRSSRRASLRNIGFAVVGEGDSARILPFDANMMSSRRLMAHMPSIGSSIMSDFTQDAWACTLCSYENADITSSSCSICGASRHGPNPSQRSRPSLRSLGAEEPAPEEPVPVNDESSLLVGSNRRSSLGSVLSRESRMSLQTTMAPIGEDRQASPPDLNKVPVRSMKKTASFKELMGMSFAKWSQDDNGPWACASCTYLNPEATYLTCEVCGQPRLKGKDDQFDSNSEFLNSSFGTGHALYLEDQDKAFQELEESMIERERMEELIEEQGRILIEMRSEQHPSFAYAGDANGSSNKNENVQQVEETKSQLQKIRAELERAIENERQEIEMVEKIQLQRRAEIESEEGVCLDDFAGPDNVNRETASPAVLEWLAQQRMLDDWKLQRSIREQHLT